MSGSDARRLEIGRRIRQMRHSRELTTSKLADLAGISAGYLSEVERGMSEISVEKLQRLSNAFHVDLQRLVEDFPPTEGTDGSETIPRALAEAAEELGLSYKHTISLLHGQRSLVARRSPKQDAEWSKEKWCEFYRKVKPFLLD